MIDSAEPDAYVFLAGIDSDANPFTDMVEMKMGEDYTICPDPERTHNPDAWCVVVMQDEFRGLVMRYPEVKVNPESQLLEFRAEIAHMPDDLEVDPSEERFCKMSSLVLQDIIQCMAEEDALVMRDVETEELVEVPKVD